MAWNHACFCYDLHLVGSSSPSSSDDEIKEAFEVAPVHRQRSHPSPSHHHAWAMGHASTNFVSSQSSQSPSSSFSSGCPEQPLSGWNIDPFEASGRPLKVVPVGRHRHKFFAQMSSNFSERPFLDFNKMQNSKRLVMVRLPVCVMC